MMQAISYPPHAASLPPRVEMPRSYRSNHVAKRSRTQLIVALSLVAAVLIVNTQLQLSITEDALMQRLGRTAEHVGEWLFRAKPFRPQSRGSASRAVSAVDISNNVQRARVAPPAPVAAPVVPNDDDDDYDVDTERPPPKKAPVAAESQQELRVKEVPEFNGLAAPFLAKRRFMKGEKRPLPVPDECNKWRSIATNPSELRLYHQHWTSLDFIDWYTFVSIFNETWHNARVKAGRRPVYVDVAANHARRWSNTYFYDRCMGWDGICAEANDAYHKELRAERHCSLIDTCVSDIVRKVNFSFTEAYGGVLRGNDKEGWGVDGKAHSTSEKFKKMFKGIKTLKCTTLRNEFNELGIKHVDFMSLDVEGYELPVLAGIDFKLVKIDVFVIENKRPEIEQFLQLEGYTKFRGVLKDDVYIRHDAPYGINKEFAGWLQTINRTDYIIHPELASQ